MATKTVSARNSYLKAVCGPGGLNCSCCRVGSKKYAKALNARGVRRLTRLSLAAVVRTGAVVGE